MPKSGFQREIERREFWSNMRELEKHRMDSEEAYDAYEKAYRRWDAGWFSLIPDWLGVIVWFLLIVLLLGLLAR